MGSRHAGSGVNAEIISLFGMIFEGEIARTVVAGMRVISKAEAAQGIQLPSRIFAARLYEPRLKTLE